MTEDQLQELKDAITATIQEKVNGKIDRIDKKIDEYIVGDLEWKKGVDTFITELTPVKDGLHVAQSLNKFFKWLGLPALGALLFYFLTK